MREQSQSEEGEYKDEEVTDETVDFAQLMLFDENNQLSSGNVTAEDEASILI